MKAVIGQVFGRLTVEATVRKPDTRGENVRWLVCQCSCDYKTDIREYDVVKGRIKSCGCLAEEVAKAR